MSEYLAQLNEQQRVAVEYMDGAQLVIAGAGSGKTRVLTYKIVHLLALGYEPWRILALTFTNKAAREMRSRIDALAGVETASKLWMGTFHSIFARILRRHADRLGFPSSFTIYDASDSKSLIKSILRDMQLDEKIYKPTTVARDISSAKNALLSPAAYLRDRDIAQHDRACRRPLTGQIYQTYCQRCRVAGAMDFDDLLYYTNVLFRDNPDILNHYREFFMYVLVDEYQDTNFAQHMIVSQLCNNLNNLCVVGDDAQSIYSFRGANIRNILNLRNAYPGLQIFKLEQNYRSTQNIINAANCLIAKNIDQIPKNVFSLNAPGDRIDVIQTYSDYEEAYYVANRVLQVKMQTSDPYNETAVLYRTNAQSRAIEEALRKRNIPYRIYGGLSFYQRKEIKDAVSYFRLSVNPHDDESLKRIINEPARGIGDTTQKKLIAAAIENGVSIFTILANPDIYNIGVNKGTLAKLEGFKNLINSFIDLNKSGANAHQVATFIIDRTRLLANLITDDAPESISKRENLQELLNATNEFVNEKTEQGFVDDVLMTNFLGEISLATDQDKDKTANDDCVTLMTIHAAKGLEYNNIFIIGAEEDLLPAAMAMSSPQEIEEERRLMYVAITRARNICTITYASSRYQNGMTKMCKPSRFLRDIDTRYLHFSNGASISQGNNEQDARRWRNAFHSNPASQYANSTAKPPQQNTPSWRSNTPNLRRINNTSSATPNAGATTQSAANLAAGMRIQHQRFGQGTITAVDTSQPDARITVEFDTVGKKVLLLKYAKFTII